MLHPAWHGNAFFYLFATLLIYAIVSSLLYIKTMRKRATEMKLMQHQHVAKVDNIRKEHSETLENLRIEMLKREEERTRQWMESEKETLHILNGVSTLLDLGEKLTTIENEKTIKLISEINDRITNIENLLKSNCGNKQEDRQIKRS